MFTVTITNTTAKAVLGFAPVVSLGHCTCMGPPTEMMLAGRLQLWNGVTGTWRPVVYDTEGTGMDYAGVFLVHPFDLRVGQSVSYRLRVALRKGQPRFRILAGESPTGSAPRPVLCARLTRFGWL